MAHIRNTSQMAVVTHFNFIDKICPHPIMWLSSTARKIVKPTSNQSPSNSPTTFAHRALSFLHTCAACHTLWRVYSSLLNSVDTVLAIMHHVVLQCYLSSPICLNSCTDEHQTLFFSLPYPPQYTIFRSRLESGANWNWHDGLFYASTPRAPLHYF